MLINNIDISKFSGKVLDVDIQNSNILNEFEDINNLIPFFQKSRVKLNIITVTFLINSKDKRKYYLDKSNLLAEMLEPFEVYFKDRNLKFKCVLKGQTSQASLKQIRGKLQLTMYGYNIENEIEVDINKILSKEITIVGNKEVPAIVEVIPVVDIIDITLEGLADDPIKIKNLKQNKKVVLDGELQTITVDGVNKYGDTDMWDFPSLKPGVNIIKISRTDCNIKIKYKPRFI